MTKFLRENKNQLIIHDLFWFPVFQTILTEDVQEFHPYVFQVLSLLLEVSKKISISRIFFNFLFHEYLVNFYNNIFAGPYSRKRSRTLHGTFSIFAHASIVGKSWKYSAFG